MDETWLNLGMRELELVLKVFEFRVSRYYASLIDWKDPDDPLSCIVMPDVLWALPDRARVFEITSPMSTSPSLMRYAGRLASDAIYPLRQKLAKLANRLMVITGNDDHIVSDAAATELLAATRVRNTRIRMAAAGHYIQDLQYRYLRTLLESFLVNRSEPRPLARTAVVTSAV